MTTPLTQLQRLQELEEIFEHRFVFEKPDRSYPYEILMRVNSDQTRSIATPQDIAKLIDDVAERVETSTLTSDRERQARELQKVRHDGYNAGLADGTDKPLLAIEQMLQKVREGERERIIQEIYFSATLYSDGSATLLHSYLERKYPDVALTPTKTDNQ